MGWKILLPQEIMSEGRKLLEDAGHTVIDGRGFETEDVLADFKEYQPDAMIVRITPITREVIESNPNLKVIVRQPLAATETADKFDVLVNVRGGGYTGQAGAIRHGIARALLNVDADYRPILKSAGFLTRDPRMKERKKYGLKAARRAPQFSKR